MQRTAGTSRTYAHDGHALGLLALEILTTMRTCGPRARLWWTERTLDNCMASVSLDSEELQGMVIHWIRKHDASSEYLKVRKSRQY